MKILKFLILLIFIFCISSCNNNDKSLNIMTFNMKFENLNSENKELFHTFENRKKGIKNSFYKYNIDVIGSQELQKWQLEELMKILGEKWSYFGVSRDGKSGETNAIIFDTRKVKFLDGNTIWLSETPNIIGSKSWESNKPRIVTYVKFKHIKTQKEFYVFNTHLDNKSKLAREKGLNIIINEMNKFQNYPIILTGDFNASINSPELNYLTLNEVFKDSFEPFEEFKVNGKTTHGFNGGIVGKPIDFIFFNKYKFKLLETKIIRDMYKNKYFLSDHYPVYSKFDFI